MWGQHHHHHRHHEQVYGYSGQYTEHHKASLTHEVLGGAAGFFAMRAYEDHQRKLGHPVQHAFAKEILAAIAAAEVDKLVETRGMDWIDREKAKRHATQQAHQLYDQQYGGQDMQYYDRNQFDWNQFHQNAHQYRSPLSIMGDQQAQYQYSQLGTQQYPGQASYPPQQYGQQPYPQQSFSPPGYAPQGYPSSQGYAPPQGYAQGYPQGYAPQAYPSQGYPPQQYGGYPPKQY
jgi:hypothetical protein